MGLEHISGEELTELMRLSWTLAAMINGGRIEPGEGEGPVSIKFTPGIADYGTWGCALTIDFTNEGTGRCSSTHFGSVASALDYVRKELNERLGGGYVRYNYQQKDTDRG